ncbi:putative Mg2+ transporter-C (MgtC) family protein [Hydrogenivirga caldilitoris]|uniref:Putative Mg2+ transporter-C (MgtC) family protein n=1 Tax=Hydrogenivirga caldilitoris TaxID=246264 RepID=A0A497XLT8_9AQUI|nr:MgtC/SapB family protein [Hydrogenivirga caldilitoris]RLJ69785.1 putative Mg2+ transporter-C (MgtC) family protein [Hydrogenivirga caldilitoris]
MLQELNFLLESYPFPIWEGLLRILLAMFLGSIIGLERERRKQPAGFRTHAVLALGSSLLSIVSIYIPTVYGTGVNVDPSRIASQVVSGIGFLGAGAILRMGVSVKGLTTAASLWTTAGIGLAVGAGMYSLSVFSTLVLLIVLSLMSKFEKEFLSKKSKTVKVVAQELSGVFEELSKVLEEGNVFKIERREGLVEVYYEVPYEPEELSLKLKELSKAGGILSVEVI